MTIWPSAQGKLKKPDWTITRQGSTGPTRPPERESLDNQKGQEALTQVHLLKTIGKNSLVACRLQTGRTHQIRVHLRPPRSCSNRRPALQSSLHPSSHAPRPKTQLNPSANSGKNQRRSKVGEFEEVLKM